MPTFAKSAPVIKDEEPRGFHPLAAAGVWVLPGVAVLLGDAGDAIFAVHDGAAIDGLWNEYVFALAMGDGVSNVSVLLDAAAPTFSTVAPPWRSIFL